MNKDDLTPILELEVDNRDGIRPTARYFGVSPSLVSYGLKHGVSRSSKIGRAMIKSGVVSAARYRRAAEFKNQERVELFDLMLDSYGVSMTQFCNDLLDEWLEEQRAQYIMDKQAWN